MVDHDKCACCGWASGYAFYYYQAELICKACYFWAKEIIDS